MNLCMAHRGWSGRAPENTMAAFQLAFQEPRIQAIELDVQLSKDGVPVVIHDFTLDRTTNGTGFVYQYTYKELSRLDAGKGERIPTLEEVLHASKGKCKVNIELKTAGNLYPDIEKRVVEVVKDNQMEEEVCLTSFDHLVIRKVKELSSPPPTGLILSGMPTMIWEQLKETGATILSMDYTFLTSAFAEEMISKDVDLIAWTVNETNMIEHVMNLHPSIQICTNYPERMFSIIK
ncbi:glycerophosphodiester phosphodiesterase family protein [Ammoniphilus sp. CFH 90114]|uniref:glycerophosphodiester phosphodiesterase n=1 Tax=Ammoniphilus sp. CFH 90114 TaxID=2493665 RepID=UPI00100DF98D|nr:glycerophosphodiester phosphodiesterase family protein [Ammoniphilus sp. CFH 90114]RXT08773.1 glycerophosphodiester phosphodiesterase [Ammoniphilus sp. CFH 90114]